MSLIYRGQTYNVTPAVETPTTEITGHYRGQAIAIKSTIGIRQSESVQLSYRGRRYTHTR